MAPFFPHVELGRKGLPVAILLAGFPDNTTSAWHTPFLDSMQQKYHIFALCMPDYIGDFSTAKAWGYSFDELTEGLNQTIENLVGSSEIFVVAHDWGSIIAQLYENKYPTRIKKLVLLDVGQNTKPSPVDLIRILTYQVWFAVAYIVSQLLGVTLGNVAYKSYYTLCPTFFRPTPHDVIRREDKYSVQVCYPYYYFWRGMLTGRPVAPKFPKCPTMFLYGTMKNTMFHGEKFLQKLDAAPGSKHVCLKAGHWITHFDPAGSFKAVSEFCV